MKSTARRIPPLPATSRFAVGQYAKITHTSIVFEVAEVSADGESIRTPKGVWYHARSCERARKPS